MIITWYGTASMGISDGAEELLFDPYVKYYNADFQNSIDDFINSKNIFITHGHCDHIQNVPAIIKKTQAKVYCTESPRESMIRNQVPEHLIVNIKPDDTIEINGFHIRVLPGKHIKFDLPIIVSTLFNIRVIKYWRNLKEIILSAKKYPEKAETVIYLIERNGKRILIMGSLGLKENRDYPADVDALILPFQGNTRITDMALEVINRIRPKKIILDHFDDAFPPVTSKVNYNMLQDKMRKLHPDIGLIIPEYKKGIAI